MITVAIEKTYKGHIGSSVDFLSLYCPLLREKYWKILRESYINVKASMALHLQSIPVYLHAKCSTDDMMQNGQDDGQ